MDQGDANYTWDWNASSLVNPSYPLQNQKFFETPIYPMGMHTLRVSDTVGFKYAIVQNGTVPLSTTSIISSLGSTSTMVAKPGIPGRVVGGIIAGGVVGGILVFGIVVLVTYFCRRRTNSQRRIESYWDKPFFEKPDDSPDSRESHPVQRKSLLVPGHLPVVAYTPDPPPSVGGHIRVRTTMNEPSNSTSTSTSNWTPTPTSTSGTANHFEEPPPPMPPIVQRDVGQADTQPHIGQVPLSRAQTAVVHLPPEYTPD